VGSGAVPAALLRADDLPEQMAKIADIGDVNVTFVRRTRARYFECAPLFHLLPKRVLDLFGLPLLRGSQWPSWPTGLASTTSCHTDFEAGSPAPGRGRCGRT
jgi:hypothetical protein